MTANETDQPLLLFHDATLNVARAVEFPPDLECDADAIVFNGRRFQSTGTGIVFWDYLVAPDHEIVGIVFNNFDIDDALKRSKLLTASNNIDSDEYGYFVRLHKSAQSADIDSAQAFGSTLFESDGDCLLYLMDWHRGGYAFDLDTGPALSAG